jgi:hypothetical protein
MDSNMRNNEFNFWDWPAQDFITARPFKEYISELKTRFVGLPIVSMHVMGVIFNNYDHEDLDVWDTKGNIELDEPIVLVCGGEHLEICFHNTSHAKVGVNTLSMTEKSYQYADWQNVSRLFPNIIGQKIDDIKLMTDTDGFYDSVFMGDGNRPNGGDYFSALLLILSNGFILEMYGQTEYMRVRENPKENIRLFPTHSRIRIGEDARGCMEFVPFSNGVELHEQSIGIGEDDWDMLHWVLRRFFPDYDMYDCDYEITVAEWEDIMEEWRFVFAVGSFDEVFERLCGIDYERAFVANSGLLRCMNNTGYLWKNRDSAWEIYMDFRDWFDRVKDSCTHINIYGI